MNEEELRLEINRLKWQQLADAAKLRAATFAASACVTSHEERARMDKIYEFLLREYANEVAALMADSNHSEASNLKRAIDSLDAIPFPWRSAE